MLYSQTNVFKIFSYCLKYGLKTNCTIVSKLQANIKKVKTEKSQHSISELKNLIFFIAINNKYAIYI